MSHCVVACDDEFVLSEVVALADEEKSEPGTNGTRVDRKDFKGDRPCDAQPPTPLTMTDEDELGDDEDVDGIETPDFDGLEDFDDEDFDDEFDDDFEEELEDEYDFDEFDERVTEEDLVAEEIVVPLVGDFVDEDAELEKPEIAEVEEAARQIGKRKAAKKSGSQP